MECTKKINVLHLRSSGGLFGAESVILNLANELNTLGFDNYIVCIDNLKNSHTEILIEAQKLNIKTDSVLCRRRIDLQSISDIRKIIKKNNIDVLHAHDYKANLFGLLATLYLPVKRITTNHLWSDDTIAIRLYEFLDGILYNYFNKIVAVSDKIYTDCKRYVLNKEKLATIYNGIGLEKYVIKNVKLENFTELQIPVNTEIIGAVGRLAAQKGFKYLIEAARQVLDVMPHVTFLIVGDGPARIELAKQAKDFNIEKNIVFAGIRADMVNMYNLMDIFVLSSISEGLPIVVLEAMAMQKPVVATDVGSVSKLVENDITGILVKAKDVKALASAIVSLLNDQQKAESLGIQGRKLVEEKYSSAIMAKQYKRVYESISLPSGILRK